MAEVLAHRSGCGFNAASQFVSQFWTASQFSASVQTCLHFLRRGAVRGDVKSFHASASPSGDGAVGERAAEGRLGRKERMILLIDCDYHPSGQQIAMLDTETGDYSEHRLKHSDGEAEKFYRDLKLQTPQIRVGLEATGHRRWFERLLTELDCELWVGDAARIAIMRVRKQKTDRQDAPCSPGVGRSW